MDTPLHGISMGVMVLYCSKISKKAWKILEPLDATIIPVCQKNYISKKGLGI